MFIALLHMEPDLKVSFGVCAPKRLEYITTITLSIALA
jgi:hypothetical protein